MLDMYAFIDNIEMAAAVVVYALLCEANVMGDSAVDLLLLQSLSLAVISVIDFVVAHW